MTRYESKPIENLDDFLDQLLEDQPLQPLPEGFSTRLIDRLENEPVVELMREPSPAGRIFVWRDVGLALMITVFSLLGLAGGGRLAGLLLEALGTLVNPQWVPFVVLTLIVQAAVLAFVVWFLVGDDELPHHHNLLKR